MEAAGYYFRSTSHDNMRKTAPYIIQYLAIQSSPPLLAAMIYMSPGRILCALKADEVSLISPRWQTKMFVLVNLACLVTQFAGVIMSGSEDLHQASTGKTMLLAGLIIQVCAFGTFLLCLIVSHARLNNLPSMILESPGVRWKRYFGGLYVVSVLFLIRNPVRIFEENQGSNGTIVSSEAYLYAFDSAFMLTVAVVMFLLHPGRLIRRARRIAKATVFESGLALEYLVLFVRCWGSTGLL
jgi:hypothetical protein